MTSATMAPVVATLARVAHRAPARVSADALDLRLLVNLAAMIGRSDQHGLLLGALGPASSASSVAYEVAAAAHARTQDDFYPAGRMHIGAVVIPAVLAVGTSNVRAAVAAGYEVLGRVSEAYAPEAQRKGWRPTGVFGPIGAAAAASVALGLDHSATAHALALASAACGGTNQSWLDGSDEWLFEVAAAARAGMEAALLAGAGARGAELAIEGPAGWAAAVFDDPGAALLVEILADDRVRTEEMAVKKYPISGIGQSPTAAASSLSGARAAIACIEVRMCPAELDYPGSRNLGPFRSRSDALMSVARCVVHALHHGGVRYSALGRALDSEEEQSIRRVELVADPTLPETSLVVRVVYTDGAEREAACDGPSILQPSWTDLTDGDELAKRFEISPPIASELVHLVATAAPAGTLLDFVRHHVAGSDGVAGGVLADRADVADAAMTTTRPTRGQRS